MAGRGGARPNSGPKKGSKQRRTIERELIARREVEALEREAQRAEERVLEARRGGKKLAKEVLEEFMHVFAGMAAVHQVSPPGSPVVNQHADERKFLRYAEMTFEFAKALAPYQSPTFKAIAVIAPPPPDAGKQLDGKVIGTIGDPARVYQQMIKRVAG